MSTKQTTLRAYEDSGRKSGSGKRPFVKKDSVVVATGDLDAADIISTRIKVKSSAEIHRVEIINTDLDSNGSPAVTAHVGYYAANAFASVTSGTVTNNAAGAVLDADALVASSTVLQAATTAPTALTIVSHVDRVNKSVWEVLGYDADPGVEVEVAITIAVAPGTAAAGTIGLFVHGVE